MGRMSFSFHDEAGKVFAKRTLKLALVLILHGVLLALVLRLPGMTPPELLSMRVEVIPMDAAQVSQPSPARAATAQTPTVLPVQAERPVEAAGPQPATVTPPAESVAAIPAAKESVKENPTPAVIAARVDASYLHNTSPTYPPLSDKNREAGTVLLLVHVTPKGEVGNIDIKQGSGFPRLDKAAHDAVKKWRFVPARRGNETLADTVVVPVVFKLPD